MCRFLCVHSASSQVSGVTALLTLSKKTPLLVPPHFRLPSFRMQWHSCSFRAFEGRNRSGSEWHRHSYLCITTRGESQTNSPEMNTSKTKEFKSPEMNTCRKMLRRNGDVSLSSGTSHERCHHEVASSRESHPPFRLADQPLGFSRGPERQSNGELSRVNKVRARDLLFGLFGAAKVPS